MEKFKSIDEFSVFNLWNIKKVNKDQLMKKSEVHTQRVGEQVDSPKFGGNEKAMVIDQAKKETKDIDMALPNDEEDIHKYHQRREAKVPGAYNQKSDSQSLDSS